MSSNDFPVVLIAYLLFAAGYAGFQWTVQVLVYRQFALVPPDAFPAYERAHQRRVSLVVGPLFAGLVLSTGGLLLFKPTGIPWWEPIAGGVLVALILVVTALLAVPLHGRLSAGFDEAAFRSLLRVDLVRAVAASLNVVVAVLLLW
ncbi:hypothetical protein ABIB25_001442 [Nakamurella sp. UYEF19]|uniref:DUF1772 domain-containing protein n=1 Tax=Nakamurella sp. UYEF19 TaxID=1756392 RepID=UPI003396D9A6